MEPADLGACFAKYDVGPHRDSEELDTPQWESTSKAKISKVGSGCSPLPGYVPNPLGLGKAQLSRGKKVEDKTNHSGRCGICDLGRYFLRFFWDW